MEDQKVKVYIHPNPEIRSFLTSQGISPPCVETFHPPLTQEMAPTLKVLGTVASQIVRDILSIPGIREIRIKPNEVRIKKEPYALWDDIQERIVETLRRALRKRQLRLVRGRSKETN